jgi:Glycosyltransferase family 87
VKVARDSRYLPWLVLAVSLVVCFGWWRWAETILVPSNTSFANAKRIPIGNNSDLYPRWLGAREALLNHRDPYSVEVTREIQLGFYGRYLDPANPSDPKDQAAFAYPLYVIFLLAPFVHLPFHTVLEIFRWIGLLGLAVCVPLWMYAVGFHSRFPFTVAGMVLAVSSSAAISEYHQQNLATLVVVMLAVAGVASVRGWLALAGLMLALSTIKPQLAGPFVCFFALWAMTDWVKRQRLIWSFAGSLLVLILAADRVSPGWIRRFLTAIRAYQNYAGDPSIVEVLLPLWLARVVAAALVCLLGLYCWRWRKAAAGTEDFGWAMAWLSGVTLVVMPKLAAYNQPLLIPALLVLLAHRRAFAGLLPRALSKGVFACLLWQWVTATILGIGSLLVGASQVRLAAGVPEYTLLALPPLTLLAVVAATFRLRNARGRISEVSLSTLRTPGGPRE